MQDNSHTSISIIKNHVEKWRRANRLSRETMVQFIVEAHETHGFDVVSGIEFSPNAKDTYERMKVNADRVYRWLDDVTTDKNLMPANFMVSVLAALPADVRVACMSEMFCSIGVVASTSDGAIDEELEVNQHLPIIMKETHEALQSVVKLNEGLDEKNLLSAHQEIGEAINTMSRFQRLVKRAIAVRSKVGSAIRLVSRAK